MVEVCGLDLFGSAIGSFEHEKEPLDSRRFGEIRNYLGGS